MIKESHREEKHRCFEGVEVMLLNLIKEYGQTPIHTPKLSDKYICSVLTVLLYSCLASFLTCCHLPTTAQITIELVPPHVIEGENVLIRINNLPENLTTLAWFRGMRIKSPQIGQYTLATNVTVLGPGHSGRETLYSNGSVQIYNVTKEDIGFYSLRVMNRHGEIVSITSIYLNVYCK
jgi:carcinoembryonic antigen-related cell adhesion molecule